MLTTPAQLAGLLRSQATKTVVLDSTWFMPNSTRVAVSEYRQKRIADARFLDLDQVASSHSLGLKHMMPTGDVFARACEKFGISPSTNVVIYDAHGVFSSPRALWMFQSFGHKNASILDGGLPRWEAEGFPINTSQPGSEDETLAEYPTPVLDPNVVRSYEQVVSNSGLSTGAELVFDARSRGRYDGTDPEPRPGLSSGHIPNSFSLPFNVFLKSNTAPNGTTYTTVASKDEMQKAVVDSAGSVKAEAVLSGQLPVVASCGSGMTAAIIWLGLELLGVRKISIYDESWTGYSLRPESVIHKTN